jgi:putative DNA primase/helicase
VDIIQNASDHRQAANSARLINALDYARLGWHVFPCYEPTKTGKKPVCACAKKSACEQIGKHPRTINGFKDATTDLGQIRAWWRQWPKANIGIATGEISGFFVLDIDPRHGGDITLEELQSAHGKLPATVEASTGGGGRHILLTHPGHEVKNDGAGKILGTGVDIRGDGGYIIVAPSLHASGQRYEWEVSSLPGDVPLAPAPAWLLDRLQAANPSTSTLRQVVHPGAAEPIPNGARNATLASLAGTMRRAGMTAEEITAGLLAVNESRCQPPLSADEVRAIAQSIARYEPATRQQSRQSLPVPISEEELQQTIDTVKKTLGTPDELTEKLKKDSGLALTKDYLEAFATLHQYDPPAWQRFHEVLSKRKISLKLVEKAMAQYLPDPAAPADGPSTTAGACLPDAPHPDIIIPFPYEMGEGRITRPIQSEGQNVVKIVAHAPLLITGKLLDITTGDQALRLDWKERGAWQHITTARGNARDGRRIVTLADQGFPVSSETANELVRYIDKLEAANSYIIPHASTSSHLGWQGSHGCKGFLWGRQWIQPDGTLAPAPDLDTLPPNQWPEDCLIFRGPSGGDGQLADAYRAHGSLDAWIKAVEGLQAYPKAMMAVYSAFVPPLLEILDCDNFVIDWSNRTSTGKTTLLRAAGSVWGNPDERAAASVLASWDATQVFIERASGALSGLPVLLDDTKRAKKPADVAGALYTVANGRGRGRGNKTGIDQTRSWRTVLLSTGESPATSFTQDGGARMRCLSVRGLPFGLHDEATRKLVVDLDMAVKCNYGHAGPLFVQWLLQQRASWPDFRAAYRDKVTQYANAVQDDAAGRLAIYAAAVYIAAELVHLALPVPWQHQDPMTTLWSAIVAEASDAAGEERALRDVMSWAYSHAEAFYGRHRSNKDGVIPPSSGWAGSWDNGIDWDDIAFHPTVLDRVLVEHGYEPEAIKAAWKERGWLDVTPGRRGYTKKQRIGRDTPWLVTITRDAVELG